MRSSQTSYLLPRCELWNSMRSKLDALSWCYRRNLFLRVVRVSDLLNLNRIMNECESKKSFKFWNKVRPQSDSRDPGSNKTKQKSYRARYSLHVRIFIRAAWRYECSHMGSISAKSKWATDNLFALIDLNNASLQIHQVNRSRMHQLLLRYCISMQSVSPISFSGHFNAKTDITTDRTYPVHTLCKHICGQYHSDIMTMHYCNSSAAIRKWSTLPAEVHR